MYRNTFFYLLYIIHLNIDFLADLCKKTPETNDPGKNNVHIPRASDYYFLGSMYSLLKEQHALTVLSYQTIVQSSLSCVDQNNP